MNGVGGIDPIILGHNPFFGVDHLSQARGAEKAQRFAQAERIVEVLRAGARAGASAVMMSTHPRAADVCELLRADGERTIRVYPLVPYVQKYVRGANERGLANLVLETLGQASLGRRLALMLRGGQGLLRRDLERMLRLLLDIELLPFRGVGLGGVFLHDALTDLALGLRMEPLLDLFRRHIEERYQVPAALTTKNLPLLRERLQSLGWEEPLVMASFNAIGFHVNPSLDQCAAAVAEPGVRFIAMNTLAAGRLHPQEAYRFLAAYPIQSVVVGMSRADHIEETVHAIREHLPRLRRERAPDFASAAIPS